MRSEHPLDSLTPIQIPSPFVLTQLKTIYYYQLTEKYQFEGESHSHWEFLFVNHGTYTVVEDDAEYILEQSQAILHPPHSFHREYARDKKASICVLGFHAECKDLSLIASKILTLNEQQRQLLTDIYSMANATLDVQDQSFFSNRTNFINHNIYGAEQIIKNKIELLFLELLGKEFQTIQKKNAAKNSGTQKTKDLIQEIQTYLLEHIEQPFSLEEIATKTAYSPNYLCRIFKQTTGETMLHYYYRLKIIEAQTLLQEKKLNLQEISDKLGFDTVQYFSSVFKKYTGITPLQFQKSAVATHLLQHTLNDF